MVAKGTVEYMDKQKTQKVLKINGSKGDSGIYG